MQMHLLLKGNQFSTVGFHAPRSTVRIGFRTPPAFLPLSGGGGVRNRRHISSMVLIGALGSMMLKAIPDPPCLSTFKQRGGGSGIGHAASQRPRSKHSDQRCSGDLTLLSRSTLNQCGAFPHCVTSRAASPCSLSSTPPHDVAPPQSIVHSPPAMCPAHFHVNLPLIMCPLYFISYPLCLLLSAVCPSLPY
jgi:hypothetical protein